MRRSKTCWRRSGSVPRFAPALWSASWFADKSETATCRQLKFSHGVARPQQTAVNPAAGRRWSQAIASSSAHRSAQSRVP